MRGEREKIKFIYKKIFLDYFLPTQKQSFGNNDEGKRVK
jgi:hypothetical protein